MASAWAKESGKDSPRASTPSGCSASGLLQNSATLRLPKDRRALVSLTRYSAEPQSMHVQPWPLANRSTARCWVRERACLRLMLFLFPAPEHPTPLYALRCAAGGGMGEIGPKESELRVDAVLGSSDLDGLRSEVRCRVFGLCFGHGRTRISGSGVTSDSWSASLCQEHETGGDRSSRVYRLCGCHPPGHRRQHLRGHSQLPTS